MICNVHSGKVLVVKQLTSLIFFVIVSCMNRNKQSMIEKKVLMVTL